MLRRMKSSVCFLFLKPSTDVFFPVNQRLSHPSAPLRCSLSGAIRRLRLTKMTARAARGARLSVAAGASFKMRKDKPKTNKGGQQHRGDNQAHCSAFQDDAGHDNYFHGDA